LPQPPKNGNGKEISRTKPHCFLHLTRANSYFRTKYGILNSNSKYEILNSKSDRIQFRLCSTDFYFSTFYSESPYSKFGSNRIWSSSRTSSPPAPSAQTALASPTAQPNPTSSRGPLRRTKPKPPGPLRGLSLPFGPARAHGPQTQAKARMAHDRTP